MNQRSSTGRQVRGVQNQLTKVKLNHHNLEISGTRYIEKLFANVRQKLNRPEGDQIVLDQKVHVWKWGSFMSTTMKAAIHLGEDYNENLVTCRNTNFNALKTLFDIRQKLIMNQKYEIKNVSTIEWPPPPKGRE